MAISLIGKLERVSLRDVWKHEAYDFTQWLQNNVDILNSVLNITLVNAERERSAGDFNVDLVAEDEGGGAIVIENQLERSNHDHLGKLITYLTAMSARAAIWIVSEPRPEHVAAIAWLNESSSADFYLIKVEAVKIGDSPAAPLFTVIVGPSVEAKSIGQSKKKMAERYEIRRQWWTQLISRPAAKLHAHITPGEYSYIQVSSGVRGLNFVYTVGQDESTAELYIDRGKDSEEINKSIFDQLFESKKEIELEFGKAIQWDRLDARRASRIRAYVNGGYKSPDDQWPDIQDRVVETMNKLEQAIKPRLKALRLD